MRNRCEIARRRPGLEPLEARMAPGAAGPAGAHDPGEGGATAYVAKLSLAPGVSTTDHARGLISLQSNGDGTMGVTVTLSRISNVSGIQLRETVPTNPQPAEAIPSTPYQIVAVLLKPSAGSGPLRHVTIRGRIDRYTLIGPLAGRPLRALVREIQAGQIQAVVQTSNGVDSNPMPGNYGSGEIEGILAAKGRQ